MAASTWLGSRAPLAQAEPAEAQTPASSSRTSSSSCSTPAKRRWQCPGRHRSACARSRRAAGDGGQEPVGQAVAQRRHPRPPRPRAPAAAARRAVARPDRPGHVVGAAPALAAPGPPPWSIGPSGCPARTTSAPAPLGPPSLWALTETRSQPAGQRGHVEPRRRLHGVGVHAPAVGRAPADRVDHVGHRLDRPHLVVGQHHRDQHRRAGSSSSPGRRGRPTRRPPRRPVQLHRRHRRPRAPARPRPGTARGPPACSTAEHTTAGAPVPPLGGRGERRRTRPGCPTRCRPR